MRTKCLNKVKRTEVIKEMKMLYTPFKKDSRMLKKNKQNERAVKIILVFDLQRVLRDTQSISKHVEA